MISEIIADFAQAITLKRRAAGTTTLGRYTPGAQTTSTISGAVVPATGKDLERLPEGMRARATIRIILETELIVHPDPDEIVWLGSTYEVQHAAPWSPGTFWDCLAVRKVNG